MINIRYKIVSDAQMAQCSISIPLGEKKKKNNFYIIWIVVSYVYMYCINNESGLVTNNVYILCGEVSMLYDIPETART